MTADALVRELLAVARGGRTTSGHVAAKSPEGYGYCVRNYSHRMTADGLVIEGQCTPMCRQTVAVIEAAEAWLLEQSAQAERQFALELVS